MAYNLPNVKQYIVDIANAVGPKFGIQTIGGWRASDEIDPNGHPAGVALDWMTDNGGQLADYLVANASQLGVIQVINNRRIWTPSQGWHAYTGSNPHTDHVHTKHNPNPPAGFDISKIVAGAVGGIGGAIAGVIGGGAVDATGDALQKMAGSFTAVGKLAEWIGKLRLPSTMIRITAGLWGFILVIVAIVLIAKAGKQSNG